MTGTPFQFVPTMRRVEKAAWNTIRRCAKAKHVTTLPLPVPVEQWVEGPLDIQLNIADLSDRGANILGLARIADRAIFVSETLQNQEARFRFTIAHELGHLVLHAKVYPGFRDTSEGEFLEQRLEREADRFAAAFLMPIPSLSSEYEKIAVQCWGEPESLLRAVAQAEASAFEVFRAKVVPALSTTFGTSLTATVRRFVDVRLPGGDEAITIQAAKAVFPSPITPQSFYRS